MSAVAVCAGSGLCCRDVGMVDMAQSNRVFVAESEAASHPLITLSVVSHKQGELVRVLLEDISRLKIQGLRVVVTLNLPEDLAWHPDDYVFPVEVLHNNQPCGFGANHNAAFKCCVTPYFCVINPDIRLEANPFPALLSCLGSTDSAVIVPAVLNLQGGLEDSVRYFPTLLGLVAKALKINNGGYSFRLGAQPFVADWVGGMFMLFRAADFAAVGGFDEGFFLYYEDVDICARIWEAGRKVVVCPQASVVHDARHTSHTNLRYLRWHLSSMGRYFCKYLFRLPAVK